MSIATSSATNERRHALWVGGAWLVTTVAVTTPAFLWESGDDESRGSSRPVAYMVVGLTLAAVSFARAGVGDDRLPPWVRTPALPRSSRWPSSA